MESRVLVDTNSLQNVSKELDIINKEIIQDLSIIKREFSDNLDEILKTNTSIEYKRRTINYLNKISDEININNENLINKLNDVTARYNEIMANMSTNIDDDIELRGK